MYLQRQLPCGLEPAPSVVKVKLQHRQKRPERSIQHGNKYSYVEERQLSWLVTYFFVGDRSPIFWGACNPTTTERSLIKAGYIKVTPIVVDRDGIVQAGELRITRAGRECVMFHRNIELIDKWINHHPRHCVSANSLWEIILHIPLSGLPKLLVSDNQTVKDFAIRRVGQLIGSGRRQPQ